MKFRDEDGLAPKVVTATTPSGLCAKLEKAGAECDLIDMQYSTTETVSGEIEYSALLLVRPKKREG